MNDNNPHDCAGHSGAHTPGPWRWMHHGGGTKTDLVAGVENVIMQIYESHGGGEMPSAANAHLIAAAPELKWRAEDLLASLDPEALNPEQFNAWCALRAAIAKAEGRQS